MSKRTQSVADFLDQMGHPRREEIDRVRSIIAEAIPAATEHIKWNAPSFAVDGVDRVTMRLRPGDRLQLVFHRGTKPSVGEGFTFDDPSGLLEWAAADRAVLTFSSPEDVEEKAEIVARLVQKWVATPVGP